MRRRSTKQSGGIDQVPRLLRSLYGVVDELEALFPGRPFTPDGHLVGSLGEVWAAHLYGLELLSPSEPTHDAKASDGRRVQIKATQRAAIGLREMPEHLLVLRLNRDSGPEEVYNGPGRKPWLGSRKRQSNGQRSISLVRLRELMRTVPPCDRLPPSNGGA